MNRSILILILNRTANELFLNKTCYKIQTPDHPFTKLTNHGGCRNNLFLIVFIFNIRRTGTFEDNWPLLRGSNSSCVPAKEQDPPVNYGQSENVLWKMNNVLRKINILDNISSPTLWGDFACPTGYNRDLREFEILCL